MGSFRTEVLRDRILVGFAGQTLEIAFEGASPAATVAPAPSAKPIQFNNFNGQDPSAWQRNLTAWDSLIVRSLYPGIDLVLRAHSNRLKTDYIVAPGADPSIIRVRYGGAESVSLAPDGHLLVGLGGGAVWSEQPPVAYQPLTSGQQPVPARFRLNEDGTAGFALGAYDRRQTLVIDPVLTLSTLLGGNGISSANAVAVDGVGDVYIAGHTDAADFPNIAPVRSRSSGVEAWVVKIRPGEGRILYATCLGGSGDDRAFALALDPSGGLYVTGWTTSPNFPAISPSQPSLSGGQDAFLLKLNTAGDQIIFSTFFGGTGSESGVALAAFSTGVWIAGETTSSNMPVLSAAKDFLSGTQDGFLARYSSAGVRLGSTYLGGAGDELIRAVAIDGSGRPYVAGSTDSTDIGLPLSAFQRTPRGARDGFVIRFGTTASSIDTGTMIGGSLGSLSLMETITAMAIDATGGIVVTGYTPSADFPTVSAWRAASGGDIDGFLARIAPDFTTLTWSTYIGGLNRDTLDGLARDSQGRIYVTGRSVSSNFPLANPIQGTTAGNHDVILLRFPSTGGAPDFSTYLGGSNADGGISVAVSADFTAWVAGVTGSSNFPLVSPVATVSALGSHGFLAGVAFSTPTAPTLVSVSPSSGSGTAQVLTVRMTDASGGGWIGAASVLINSTLSGQRACLINYDRSANTLSLNPDPGSAWTGGAPGAALTLANSQCDLRLSGSTVTIAGTQIDLRLDLVFKTTFAGAKTVYATARNGSGLSVSWAQLGGYTVTGTGNRAPSTPTASPAAGGGTRQVFTLTFTDLDGAADLVEAGFTLGHAPAAPQSCTLAFQRSRNRVLLASDDGASWLEGIPGAAAQLENSQCRVRLATTTFSTSGNNWTVLADVEALPAWYGVKALFLRASDASAASVGWISSGAYRAGGSIGNPPGLSRLTPSSGTGSGTLFEIAYWDADGSNDIATVTMLINSNHSGANGCFIIADRRYNSLYLASDDGRTWNGATAGSQAQLHNTQCVLKAASSTFTYSGLTLIIRLEIAFKTPFLGSKTVWSHATDLSGRTSPPLGWTGAYTVTSAGAYWFNLDSPAERWMPKPSLPKPAGFTASFVTAAIQPQLWNQRPTPSLAARAPNNPHPPSASPQTGKLSHARRQFG